MKRISVRERQELEQSIKIRELDKGLRQENGGSQVVRIRIGVLKRLLARA